MSGERTSVDRGFEALSNARRRRLLLALLEANPQDATSLPSGEDQREVRRRTLRYHHVHLPKLEEAGYVTWDRDTNQVTKGPQFEEIKPLLELLRDHPDELPEDLV